MNFSRLYDFIELMARKHSPANAAVIYLGGEKVFFHSAGYSSLEEKKPFTGKEYVNIYSCSKVATVTAAAQLLECGEFLLNDPLYEYIPEFRYMSVKEKDGSLRDAKTPIRIGDLFSMTAGFDYNCSSPAIKRAGEITDGKFDTLTVIRELASEPLSFDPGEHWQYSLCHDVLAGLVEIVSGMKFRDYMKKNIFEPLGMNDTFYHHTKETLENTAEQYTFVSKTESVELDPVEAQRYGKTDEGIFVNVGKNNNFVFGEEYDSGGAGIITTVDDYVKLVNALSQNGMGATGERVLSPYTVSLMKTNRLNSKQMVDYNWEALRGYGYGLGVRTHIAPDLSGSIASIGEFGWGGAAGATVITDSELGLALFYVQHCLNPREAWYQPRLRNVLYGCI